MSMRNSSFLAIGLAMVMAAPMSAQQTHSTDVALQSATNIAAPATDPSIEPVGAVPAWPVLSTVSVLVPASGPTASALFADPYAPVTDMTVSELAMMPASGGSENVALMIVGGAALLIGSFIDGDTGTIIMVGGGAVGLLGLWRYLQ